MEDFAYSYDSYASQVFLEQLKSNCLAIVHPQAVAYLLVI